MKLLEPAIGGKLSDDPIALRAGFGVNHRIEIIIPIGSGIAVVAMRDGRVLTHQFGDGVEFICGYAPSAKCIGGETCVAMLKNGAHFTYFLLSGEIFDALDEFIF